MKEKIITVAILGLGSRGADSYGQLLNKDPRFNIVAICDLRKDKVERFKAEFNVNANNCFTDEYEFFKVKRADIMVIATQDRDHVRHALAALKLGYDMLLEKPITPVKQECYDLLKAQEKYGGKVLVCHVLRYAPVYCAVAKLIDEGTIGQLVDIHAIEQVAYWHQAHSYVRGNWRREEDTSPMIMAKCCHDMDLLQYYAKSKAKTVSSIGELTFFKKENQPKGAADRCDKCKFDKTCPYSAYRTYIERWKKAGSPKSMWPMNVVCSDTVLTEKGIINAYKNNNYGQCVFASDNNVVDHQETNILFENGITANLSMTAFTGEGGRIYKFHGTYGEIDMDEERGELTIKKFGEKPDVKKFSELPDVSGGHGGGDAALVKSLYDMVTGKAVPRTALKDSIESHLMAIAAEESRKENGKKIIIHK